MDHQLESLIARYGDPDLSPDERRRLNTALARDPAARETLDQYRRLDDLLADLPAPAPTALATIPSRVRAAIDRPRRRFFATASLLATAAALALVAGAWLFFAPSANRPQSRVDVAAISDYTPPAHRVNIVNLAAEQPARQQPRVSVIRLVAGPIQSRPADPEPRGEVICSFSEPAASPSETGGDKPKDQTGLGIFWNGST